MRNTKLPVLAAAIAVMGLMGGLASSASADSITCKISGAIKLVPGLTETPAVQHIEVVKKKGALLSECTGTETKATGGAVRINMETTEPVSCSALKGSGAPVTPDGALFRWLPKGEVGKSGGRISIPLTEKPVLISGFLYGDYAQPFLGDTVTGEVTQSYGPCGSSAHSKGGRPLKGHFSGTITIS
jgi:hypothetical protein